MERDQLLSDNMALAVHWATKYRNKGADLEDLIQVAYVGLIKAADGFSEDNGAKFSTYASTIIVRHIWSFLNSENKTKLVRVNEPDGAVYQSEYDDILDEALEKLDDKELDIISMRFGLGGNRLQSLEEIGNKYGLSRERIRQIEKRAMTKMRSSEKVIELKEYL